MAYKISSFIISLILIGLVTFGFAQLYGDMNKNYPRTDYDNDTFDDFNKLSELTTIAEDTQEATDIRVESGITDIIGGYFKSAYQALRVSVASVDTFTSLSETAADKSGIPHVGTIISALIAIVLIAIFIGVFISQMTKKDA